MLPAVDTTPTSVEFLRIDAPFSRKLIEEGMHPQFSTRWKRYFQRRRHQRVAFRTWKNWKGAWWKWNERGKNLLTISQTSRLKSPPTSVESTCCLKWLNTTAWKPSSFMEHIQENAEQAVRSMLKDLSLRKGLAEIDSLEAEDHLDDGSPIRLKITINRNDGSAIFDFSGTGPELWGNLNTPLAVTNSAILYSLRCLIQQEIPLNQGCLNPIRIVVPQDPYCHPLKKQQLLVECTDFPASDGCYLPCIQCLCSIPGMHQQFHFRQWSLRLLRNHWRRFRTGESWHGTSGVHTHMTNTRITDPEVLERRYPVMLREFSLRKHSGGTGKFQGGDGLVREVEFLNLWMPPFYRNAESINPMDLKVEILGNAEPTCSSEMTDRSCIWAAKMKYVRFLAKRCGLKLLVGEHMEKIKIYFFKLGIILPLSLLILI